MPSSIQFLQRSVDSASLQALEHCPPLIARLYAARGVNDAEDASYSLTRLPRPEQISNLQQAAICLADCIEAQGSILVFGDYDADGATSTALCMRALAMLGHQRCDFMLPDRIVDGYGVSANVARRIIAAGPDLVITVDTGIASFDGLRLLRQAGIKVVVTDHHLPAQALPTAECIVNPNAFNDPAGRCLAGVGVAFYVMLALRAELRARKWFTSRPEPNLAECLDLVALGTVADLVPLDYTNRTLVSEGLQRIRKGVGSAGINALIERAGKSRQQLTSQDIGFAIAPRINAAGRLDDMRIGVLALLATDDQTAAPLTFELDQINHYRRELQGEMTDQAERMLASLEQEQGADRFSRVLHQADWHEGIVGIIASRVKDLSFRPSICFAATDQDQLKGSCRSIPGVHMRDMLDLVDKKYPGLMLRFGGHAMAAGLTIEAGNLARFADAFETVIREQTEASVFNNQVSHDGRLSAAELTLDTAQMLERAGPWGQRFPLPSFIGEFEVLNCRILADRHLKLVLRSGPQQHSIDAIKFYASDEELAANPDRINIHYELSVNEFREAINPQLIIRHIIA